jgi:hypothetical protein
VHTKWHKHVGPGFLFLWPINSNKTKVARGGREKRRQTRGDKDEGGDTEETDPSPTMAVAVASHKVKPKFK